MVDALKREILERQGYKIVGEHSGVKVCHWAKSKLTTQVRLPSPGYTYSAEVSGDLKDVTILLSLYDAGGSLMASYSGAHDLSG